jgi:hypothetical protein
VRLQHARQHHRQAVQHHLRQEHHEHASPHLDGPRARRRVTEQRPGEQGRGEGPGERDRHEHDDGPGEQRARGPRGGGAVAGRDRPASRGTTTAASAPPATTSKTTFGTAFTAV